MRGAALGLAHLVRRSPVAGRRFRRAGQANVPRDHGGDPTSAPSSGRPTDPPGLRSLFRVSVDDASACSRIPLARHRYEGLRRMSRSGPACPRLLVAPAAAALLAERWQVARRDRACSSRLCLRAPAARRWPYLVRVRGHGGRRAPAHAARRRLRLDVAVERPDRARARSLDVTTEELSGRGGPSRPARRRHARVRGLRVAPRPRRLLRRRGSRAGRRSSSRSRRRLVPTLERDVRGLVEALRGRGVEVEGLRGRARLVSPLVSGSLERALNLAEAMEARGFGRPVRPGRRRRAGGPSIGLRSSRRCVLVVGARVAVADRTRRLASPTAAPTGRRFRSLAGCRARARSCCSRVASGCGKSTLLRALAGLVPHFHGGQVRRRVEIGGRDTRRTRPAELAGTVATLFQDPEDQVVFGGVSPRSAFGIENAGSPAGRDRARVREAALDDGRRRAPGRAERRRALRRRAPTRLPRLDARAEPALLLLDEPTSQLDPEGARSAARARASRCARARVPRS